MLNPVSSYMFNIPDIVLFSSYFTFLSRLDNAPSLLQYTLVSQFGGPLCCSSNSVVHRQLQDTLIVLQSLKNCTLLPEEIYALTRLYVCLNQFYACFQSFTEICCIWHSWFAITSFQIVL